nr:hypothetical protein [Tanacetum cinerariifolium]
ERVTVFDVWREVVVSGMKWDREEANGG